MDLIEAEARMGEPRMAKNDQPLDAQARAEIIQAVNLHKTDAGTTNRQIAKQISRSEGVVSAVLTGTYRGKTDAVLRELDQMLQDARKRAKAPKRGSFVRIQLAKEIYSVAETAVRLNTIGVVYGPAGCGKTITLRAIAAERRNSAYLVIDDTWSRGALAEALAAEIGVAQRSARTSRNIAKINTRLRGSNRLILIDEAQHLDKEGLNMLRQIHDETEVPMLWGGTPSLYDLLMDGKGDRKRGATIYSRVGIIHDLTERATDRGQPLYTVDDVCRVFDSMQLRVHGGGKPIRLSADAKDWLFRVANLITTGGDDGGLRVCVNAIRVAVYAHQTQTELAKTGVLTAAMLWRMNRQLLGVGIAKDLKAQADLARKAAG